MGVLSTQRAINESSRDAWEAYADHRKRVTELVSGTSAASLVLLGAGNCNDVALAALVRIYDEVRLVDVDPESLARARDAQPEDVRSKLRLAAPIDLSGLDAIVQGAPLPEPRAVAAGLVRAIGFAAASVVASPCLLSQLIGAAAARVGAGHPRFLQVVRFVRDVHLELLAGLLAPGGRAVLVTDFVSSDTCPEILTAPPEALPALARRLVAEKNFFTGTNPFLLEAAPDALSVPVEDVTLESPWLWSLGAKRGYLVSALRFRRS